MYLSQVKKFSAHPILYFVIPLCFISLGVFNFYVSQDIDVHETISLMTDKVGVNGTFAIMMGQLAIGLWIVWAWVKLAQRQSIRSLTTGREKVDWKRIFMSFFIWGGIMVTMTLLSYYSKPENYQWNFNWDNFFPFLIIALLLVPMQTSFEEYLFRGNLLQGLALVTNNRWIPLVITSVLFGLMHLANPEVEKIGPIIMVYYIGTGLFLGILTLMDDGLELALGFHAANNLIGALLVTSDWTVFQTHSIFKDLSEPNTGFEIIVPIFIIFPILLFLFSKIYKWDHWKQKLFGELETLEEETIKEI